MTGLACILLRLGQKSEVDGPAASLCEPDARRGAMSAAVQSDAERLTNLLTIGHGFIKQGKSWYGSSRTRHIWCSPDLSTIFWGDDGRKNIKGECPIAKLKGVAARGRERPRGPWHLELLFVSRRLELQVKNHAEFCTWSDCFGFLLAQPHSWYVGRPSAPLAAP